jgi:DNA polymerase-3 subunit delta
VVLVEEAIREAESGALRPVYLVLGEERLLVEQAVRAIRDAATKGGIPGFNEDKYQAGEVKVDAVLGAARVLPMMAPKRFVLVRGVERWEGRDEEAEPTKAKETPLDALAEYAKAPVDSTILVLVAQKLHGQRRLVTTAKKAGFVVSCEPIPRRELPRWVFERAKSMGHPIDRVVADQLAELSGPELGSVADALERLSLYVGPKAPITEDALAAVVTRVRPSTAWDLVDAICARRLGQALTVLANVEGGRDTELPLLGSIAWTVRQMAKLEGFLDAGEPLAEAARRAGVPPFKVDSTRDALRRMPKGTMARWLRHLAEADRALKGSKRPGRAVLETLLVDLCR